MKNSGRCSTASSGAASEEKIVSTDAEITKGWNLRGKNRIDAVLAFSEDVSYRIEETLEKCDRIDERAQFLLGPNRLVGPSQMDF